MLFMGMSSRRIVKSNGLEAPGRTTLIVTFEAFEALHGLVVRYLFADERLSVYCHNAVAGLNARGLRRTAVYGRDYAYRVVDYGELYSYSRKAPFKILH